MMDTSTLIAIWLLIFLAIFLNGNSVRERYLQSRRRKRGKKQMPEELIKEFIGKQVSVTCMNAIASAKGELVATEGGWIKFRQKNNVRLINADMIVDITLVDK